MKNYDIEKIRNIALLGGSGCGKTTLTEQLLNTAKATTRVGKIEDGNTVMDYDADEIEKKMSISMGIGHLSWDGHWINLLDTPGYPDYYGEQISASMAAETLLVVVNAAGSFDVGVELALELMARKKSSAKGVIVNRLDNEHAEYSKALEQISENSDFIPAPIFVPIGREAQFQGVVDIVKGKAYINDKIADIPADMQDEVEEYRMKLMEAVAETDDDLLEKYFEEGELTSEELSNGIRSGILKGALMPVFACSAGQNIGISALLNAFVEYLPSANAAKEITLINDGETKTIALKPDGDPVGYIFKSFSDPNVGDIAYVRLFSGAIKSGTEVYIPEKDSKDKIGTMYYILGKNRTDAPILRAGGIGGLVKLKVGCGLTSVMKPGTEFRVVAPELPAPVFWQTIHALNQSDEDKIGGALAKLIDDDPTAKAYFDSETKQQVISGLGEQQIGLIKKRLKTRFKVEAELEEPKVPYRETITSSAQVNYKHKKQSGGRGQYGEVYFRVRPTKRGEGFNFINGIVGGKIPSKFIPAIEKGLRETLDKGIIAGYQVVDIEVEVYEGSYHDVDSSEMAFKIASSQALKKGFKDSKPILLEPICNLQIIIPNEYMGDVMGDISTRRGKIQGMEQKGTKQILNAQLPLSELYGYFPALKSLTQGRGRFTKEISHFEKVPHEIVTKVIAAFEEED
ncbi:MAG: elongation factor G [Candidatus Cloacimonetes bacterium]|nr:elongation factor G [Candidatus Cloacimonadota bacterium]